MARIAGYGFAACEKILIDCVDDLNHPAGGALDRDVVRILLPIAEDGIAMTVGAVVAQCRGEESHRFHELINGNSFQHLDVFKDILRHQRLFLGSSESASGR